MENGWKPNVEISPNCPRCGSCNTKFCYYNNYSLTQPRYFCKGCRRYWTKGGSLRNVPVGGGCRKNRRGKSLRMSTINSLGCRDTLPIENSCGPSKEVPLVESTNDSHIDLAVVYANFLKKQPESKSSRDQTGEPPNGSFGHSSQEYSSMCDSTIQESSVAAGCMNPAGHLWETHLSHNYNPLYFGGFDYTSKNQDRMLKHSSNEDARGTQNLPPLPDEDLGIQEFVWSSQMMVNHHVMQTQLPVLDHEAQYRNLLVNSLDHFGL